MSLRDEQMAKDGPMTCEHQQCIAWRNRNPEFAQQLQAAGIIAHYMGYSGIFVGEYFMLDGITPITEQCLRTMLVESIEARVEGLKAKRETAASAWTFNDSTNLMKNQRAIQRISDEAEELRTEGKPIDVRINPHD